MSRFCKINASRVVQSCKKGTHKPKANVVVAVVGVVVVPIVNLAVVRVVVPAAAAVTAVAVIVGIPAP